VLNEKFKGIVHRTMVLDNVRDDLARKKNTGETNIQEESRIISMFAQKRRRLNAVETEIYAGKCKFNQEHKNCCAGKGLRGAELTKGPSANKR